MFELYLQSNEKKKNHGATNGDSLVNIVSAIGKILSFVFISPYQGMMVHLRHHPRLTHCLLWICVISVPLYLFFLDDQLVNFILSNRLFARLPDLFFKLRLLLFLFVVSHIYLFIVFLSHQKRKSNTNHNFKELGLVPSFKSGAIRYLTEYRLDKDQTRLLASNPGLPLSAFKSKQTDIEATFDFYVTDISFGKSSKLLRIDYRRKEFPKKIEYADFIKDYNLKPYEFNIGLSLNGRKIRYNLKDMVHLLVAGETGGGKSTFLRQFIVDLLQSKNIEMYLVDLKGGVEFQTFKDVDNVTLIKEFNDVDGVLEKLNEILSNRLSILEENKVNDISSYEKKTKKKIPRIVFVIDECAEIFLKSSSHDKAAKALLMDIRFNLGRLARLSRAVGIHIVLATQRADKGAIDMQAKDNMVSRLCFRVNNDYASQMVLRDGRAARLPKVQGRAIWKEGNNQFEIQVPFLSQKNAEDILNENRSSKEG